jgi:phosphate regulon transcriptional regulator PhoB
MPKHTVMIVEDEKDILDLVEFNLRQADCEVVRAQDGLEALRLIEQTRPDLVILDLMLPKMDGKEVCRRIRQREETRAIPVLMLTAKSDEVDRIIGFEIGADDYMTKPFSPRELVLRVQAILRRTREQVLAPQILRFGDLAIDPERHRVEVQGNAVELTATEFRLLHYMASRPGRVLSRETLLDRVWGYAYEGYARTVDTHVRRLRQKLGSSRDRIETLRGLGYRFKED